MISKEPINNFEFRNNVFYTNSAREAFSLIIENILVNSGQKILMPSYIGETETEGSGVFDPVRQNKVGFDFYNFKRHLEPDLENIEEMLISGTFKALLVIHYFGIIHTSMKSLVSLCKKYNVLLIEDCAHGAHSVQNKTNMGDFGDFSFFSIHKLTSSEDGGLLKINNNKFLLKRKRPINSWSTFEDFIFTEFEKVNKIKINNFEYYLKKWPKNEFVTPMYKTINKGIVPLNFPVIIKNNRREKVYFKLIEKGVVTCALYYRMIKEINQEKFQNSFNISNSILNFPVHQGTETKDIDFILSKLLLTLKELD